MANYRQGDDAKVISRIAKDVYGGYRPMFEAHGWAGAGEELMIFAPPLIVRDYGSVRAFEIAHEGTLDDLWERGYSVLFTTFWDWTPETWAAVGWSNDRGRSRRDSLLKQLTDPFITVCAVTKTKSTAGEMMRGKVVGCYLTSHQTGDRDLFTHPGQHPRQPDKWRHAVRALRAFIFLPQDQLEISEFYPDYAVPAKSVSVGAQGVIISDLAQIRLLRDLRRAEVEIYSPFVLGGNSREPGPSKGMVRGGNASKKEHVVRGATEWLERELYILRLEGDVSAMLGEPAGSKRIVKVGVGACPETRRQAFQKALPKGAFKWCIDRSSQMCGMTPCASHTIALRGEYAMKKHLARYGQWLDAEFYLASDEVIDRAWQLACAAVDERKSG